LNIEVEDPWILYGSIGTFIAMAQNYALFSNETVPPIGTGIPLTIFNQGDVFPTTSVHEALVTGMNTYYSPSIRQIENSIESHVHSSVGLRELMEKFNLTHDECSAICYYTADARQFGGLLEKSPYRVLNNSLACRNTDELEHWKPFLFYLISALKKLPNFTGTVYRALDRPLQTLSKQYKPGNSVVWVAFTSTSKNRDIMTLFTGKSEGTLMRISVVEGKEISQFSLFPSESEVLLPPNTFCFVDEICTENMKDLLKLNNGIDALILTQTPTPKELKLDFGNILSENYKQLLQKEKEKK